MNLQPTTEVFAPGEDHTWLGSAHGTEAVESIQLDGSAFTGTWTDGIVPSGVALGKVTATGLYVPYTDAGTNGVGSDTCVGFLFTTVEVGVAGSEVDSPAALFTHGKVDESNLPANHGVTAAAKVDLGTAVRFV